jgi:hypothetical protein
VRSGNDMAKGIRPEPKFLCFNSQGKQKLIEMFPGYFKQNEEATSVTLHISPAYHIVR